MSVELKPFKPGRKVSEPSEEEITRELGTGSKLAPLVDKLRDLENWIGKLTVGASFCALLIIRQAPFKLKGRSI